MVMASLTLSQEIRRALTSTYKKERKLDFISEFYADLDYDKDGKLVIAKSA
jgi:lactam utilization protein B